MNIHVFSDFSNFYRQFIKGFSKIAALLTSLLKPTMATAIFLRIKEYLETSRKGGNKVASIKAVGGRFKIGVIKLTKGKKSKNLAKSKKSAKLKKSDFTKAKNSENLAKSKKSNIKKSA